MFKFFFIELDLSTSINLEKYEELLQSAKLSSNDSCANTLLPKMQITYGYILENDGTHDDFLRHVFEALFITTNARFKTYI